MQTLNKQEGKLHVDVADQEEGSYIRKGTPVIVETRVDNFKNLFVQVTSMHGIVRLSYRDTDIDWLLGK